VWSFVSHPIYSMALCLDAVKSLHFAFAQHNLISCVDAWEMIPYELVNLL
jgi:hypothetical protein